MRKNFIASYGIKLGKGKKCSCKIGLYVQPYSATREQFKIYKEKGNREYHEDTKSK